MQDRVDDPLGIVVDGEGNWELINPLASDKGDGKPSTIRLGWDRGPFRSYAPRAKCLGTLGFARKVRMASR
ncbi:MAG: hypothetical protein NZX77_06765, partial [Polyangiaceae bacterium]|nr:hypothetical protein [Polyangiaceae bacterium]